jgi:hypothetical protein
MIGGFSQNAGPGRAIRARPVKIHLQLLFLLSLLSLLSLPPLSLNKSAPDEVRDSMLARQAGVLARRQECRRLARGDAVIFTRPCTYYITVENHNGNMRGGASMTSPPMIGWSSPVVGALEDRGDHSLLLRPLRRLLRPPVRCASVASAATDSPSHLASWRCNGSRPRIVGCGCSSCPAGCCWACCCPSSWGSRCSHWGSCCGLHTGRGRHRVALRGVSRHLTGSARSSRPLRRSTCTS